MNYVVQRLPFYQRLITVQITDGETCEFTVGEIVYNLDGLVQTMARDFRSKKKGKRRD